MGCINKICIRPITFANNTQKGNEVISIARTLYVGNLPWSTQAEDLERAFAEYGEVVSSRIITDRQTGRSRGFGFVEVKDEDAESMISALNGAEMSGRVITVNEARARTENNPRW
ncbi:MAG: RNA-binding protein [Candidatus Desulforudis sp.]|jgi:RNA recognition motif-containing protein|nr:RNA-binding protein [Desulforudis sp.]MBV1736270.1 RNA-binding protein [Desulforudis sp.]MBV1769004.1 RNA-binding protein [Desulforudis sp.]